MGLSTVDNLGAKEDELARAYLCFRHCNSVFKVALPPGPAGAERGGGVEPSDRCDCPCACPGDKLEDRRVVKRHIDFGGDSLCQWVSNICSNLQYRAGGVELSLLQRLVLAIGKALNQVVLERQVEVLR